MENFFDLLTLLAQLIISLAIIALLLMGLVRPLFKYLAANQEIKHHKRHGDSMPIADSVPDVYETPHDDRTSVDTGHSTRSSKKELLDRLAASDPEKAGNLIKKWLNEE